MIPLLPAFFSTCFDNCVPLYKVHSTNVCFRQILEQIHLNDCERLEIQTKNNSYSNQFRKFWDNFCLLAEAASIASLALVKHSSKRNLKLNKQGLKSACYAHVTIPRLHLFKRCSCRRSMVQAKCC